MAQFIYSMQKVRKAVGDKVILDDVTLSFYPGAKIGVLGPNGAGKSTVLKMMAGLDHPSNGDAKLTPGYSVGILMQEPVLDEKKNVLENVQEGVKGIRDVILRYEELNEKMGAPDADFEKILEEQTPLLDQIEAANAWELDSQIEQAMDALRLPPPDADVSVLSGGERRRVALCKLLLEAPDLLLLDEPTNHLDAESVLWLEKFLDDYKGTVMAVTHDRYFLDNVAGWILELDRGRGIPFQGNYSSWLEQKQERLAHEEKTESAPPRTLARELEWGPASPPARHAQANARLGAYERLLAEEQNVKLEGVEIHIPPGPRLGDVVIEAEGVRKGFGDRLLVDNLTFSLPPAGIVGVVGPNGAGKTTLFRMIAGEEQPDD